jgi:hypothetical protein
VSVKPEIVIHSKSTVSNAPCLTLQSLPLSYSYREARKCVLRLHRPTTVVQGTVSDNECEINVPKSVHHHTIQTIQPTSCNSFTSLFDVFVWLNIFRVSPRPSSGAYNCIRSLWFYRWSVVVGALLVVVWQTTTNNAPAPSLQR